MHWLTLSVTPNFYRTWTQVHVRYMLSPVRLSVVCLSVTLVRPTQPGKIFRYVSTLFGTLAIHWHPRKNFTEIFPGEPSIGGVKHKRGSQI